jgi:predicted nucleic acid-binding protein
MPPGQMRTEEITALTRGGKSMVLVDTDVLLDVLRDDPQWAAGSQRSLESASLTDSLAINAVIYSELSRLSG